MSRVTRAFRITGKLIKFLIGVLIFTVIALIIWRVVSSNNPKDMKRLIPNEKLISAYEEKGDDLRIFKQDQRSVTSGTHNYGYFAVTDYAFIPDANQIQLLFRYNNSTITATAEDYGLEETPARSDNIYDVTLLFAIDITPENKDDNLETDEDSVRFVRVHASDCESGEKKLYNFRRFVFDLETAELDLNYLLDEELLIAVYTDVYYIGDLDYEETPYGTLCLYDYLEKNIEIKPKKTLFERFSDEE